MSAKVDIRGRVLKATKVDVQGSVLLPRYMSIKVDTRSIMQQRPVYIHIQHCEQSKKKLFSTQELRKLHTTKWNEFIQVHIEYMYAKFRQVELIQTRGILFIQTTNRGRRGNIGDYNTHIANRDTKRNK